MGYGGIIGKTTASWDSTQILSPGTAELFGLGSNATPDDVFRTIRGPGAVTGTYPVATGNSVSAGDVVDIEDGQVMRSAVAVANTENGVSTNVVTSTGIAKLNSTYSIYVARFTQGSQQFCNAWLVENETTQTVDAITLYSGSANKFSIVRLTDTKFIVGYVRSNSFMCKVGTLSEEKISFGSEFQIDASNMGGAVIVGLTETTALAITGYQEQITRAYVLTVSGTSVSKGSGMDMPSGNISATDISAALLSDAASGNKRVFVFLTDNHDSSKGKAVIATINNSNVVTWGSIVTLYNEVTGSSSCAAKENTVVVSFNTSTTTAYCKAVLVSGTTIESIGENEPLIPSLSTSATASYTNVSLVGEKFVVSWNQGYGYSAVLDVNGTEVSQNKAYYFNTNDSSHLRMAGVDSTHFIVCYADGNNSGYGTLSRLEINGTQIAGSFTYNATQAIALQSGSSGDSIEVIFSGTTAADFVEAGQEIASDGVYGFAPVDGFLSVIPYWAGNTKIATGSYTGTGAYGSSGPNKLTFGFKPSLVIITGNYGNYADCCFFPVLYLNSEYHAGGYSGRAGNQTVPTESAYAKIDGTTLSWYSGSSTNIQLNYPSISYYYIALG